MLTISSDSFVIEKEISHKLFYGKCEFYFKSIYVIIDLRKKIINYKIYLNHEEIYTTEDLDKAVNLYNNDVENKLK